MNRRDFVLSSFLSGVAAPVFATLQTEQFESACQTLDQATASGQISAAVLHVIHKEQTFSQHFGTPESADAMFLLGSVSKPICITALMTLFDKGEFQLDNPAQKFLPKFTGEGRERITMRDLMTHVSGLPDQLPENDTLRRSHADLNEFVEKAVRTPLLFQPRARYGYSSMAILLASHVAELISGTNIRDLVEQTVLDPLEMKHSAQGFGRFQLSDFVPCQTEFAAPESGAGDPTAKDWDWNSSYWRGLGAPWGGTHASAPDVGRFLAEFLQEQGRILKPETARLMIRNHNAKKLTPRGLGFNVGVSAGSRGCSANTFGHTGSTGTLAWADPDREAICVVLTSLPGRAVEPHPRDLAGAAVVASLK
ncbi:MAG: serine hydrolase domain-containing protein [Planctomycetaceae bacterium]